MGNTLTLIGSSLVRIAYAVLLIVFATTPAVSVAFGDTGAARHVVNRDADEAILPSAAQATSDSSASDKSVPQIAFSHEGALHPGTSSISDMPCSKVVVPHGLAPDRPEASVPETANPNISHQNILAPDVAAPITPEPDDLVANGLAPPDHVSPSAPGGGHVAIAPYGAAGYGARQDALTDVVGYVQGTQRDTALNTIAGYSGGFVSSAAIPPSQTNFIAGFLTAPHRTASTRGTLNSNSPHKAGDFDFKLLCSGTTAASDEAVAS